MNAASAQSCRRLSFDHSALFSCRALRAAKRSPEGNATEVPVCAAVWALLSLKTKGRGIARGWMDWRFMDGLIERRLKMNGGVREARQTTWLCFRNG